MELKFKATGTKWQIKIEDSLSSAKQAEIQQAIDGRVERFTQAYSRFLDDSIVAHIAKSAGEYELPDDAEPMIRLYEEFYRLSDGKITPLIGGMMVDAGYDNTYSFQPKPMRPVPKLDEVLEFKAPFLTTKKPVQLDFGAAGKGYLVDLVGELLEQHKINNYFINAGGDMLQRGSGSIKIGLEDPEDTTKALGALELSNKSLCASSTNRRAWKGYHHVMNPETHTSTTGVVATWALADSTLLADMLTTALFFMEPNKLLERYDFEYMVIRDHDQLEASPVFADSLFRAEDVQ